VVIYGL